MSARLTNVRAKIERAKHHINDLEGKIIAFRDTDPYALRCDYDPQAQERTFRVCVRTALPPAIPVIAGEVAHHLRSALDYLAWQLVEANGGTPDRKTYFPLDKTPPGDEAAFARKVQGMSATAVNLIRSKQPYQPGFEVLGMLHDVDNFDKHRLLLVVACGFRQFGFSFRHPILEVDPALRAMVDSHFAEPPIPVSPIAPDSFVITNDGAEVARMSGGPEPQMDEELHFPYEITFAQPEVVHGQPIIPLLRQCCQFVEDVVHDFAPLL